MSAKKKTMTMTDKERAEIRRHVADREKLAKAMAVERSAELLAEFEKQIAAIYAWSDSDVWADAMASARAAVDQASRTVAAECERLGIPVAFRPHLGMYWSGRGENAVNERRAELRRVAKAEIKRIEEQAKVTIETIHLKARVKLTELGLHSADAKAFLAALPAVESLMPPLTIGRIEDLMLRQIKAQPSYGRPRIGADAEDKDEHHDA
jgi:hypothetical protein